MGRPDVLAGMWTAPRRRDDMVDRRRQMLGCLRLPVDRISAYLAKPAIALEYLEAAENLKFNAICTGEPAMPRSPKGFALIGPEPVFLRRPPPTFQ